MDEAVSRLGVSESVLGSGEWIRLEGEGRSAAGARETEDATGTGQDVSEKEKLAGQDLSEKEKLAMAVEKNLPMHLQWLGLSEGEAAAAPRQSAFTGGAEPRDGDGGSTATDEGLDESRAHQAPLPDIYAVGLQEVDTSVGAAMFTAFETKRAKEWEDVIARRSRALKGLRRFARFKD